jgi:hypothetical protein
MSSKTINQKVLNSIGSTNYNEYMLLTKGKEIDSILDDRSPVFKMYNYRDMLLNSEVGQNIDIDSIERNLQNNDDIKLKVQLQNLFLESISNSTFKIVKNMLTNNTFGWNVKRLAEVHKKHKYYRIFRLLSIEYNNWLN